MLHGNTACEHTLRLAGLDCSAVAYCQARARLPLSVFEQLEPWDLELVEAPGVPLSYRVKDKMRLSKDKLRLTVNPR